MARKKKMEEKKEVKTSMRMRAMAAVAKKRMTKKKEMRMTRYSP